MVTKQKVLDFNQIRVLMWEDQSLIIEYDDETMSLKIGELLYIVQEWQKEFGPIRFLVTEEWKGVEGSND